MVNNDNQYDQFDQWLRSQFDKTENLPPASPGFCSQVMSGISSRPLAWHIRLRRFIFRPHQLQWNIATTLMPVALTVFIMTAIQSTFLFKPQPVPEASSLVNLTFNVQLEDAQQVALTGDFNQWQSNTKLHKNMQGTWTVSVQLKPGLHEYMFIIDGKKWINDPDAMQYQDDGFGGKNSVIIVNSKRIKTENRHAI